MADPVAPAPPASEGPRATGAPAAAPSPGIPARAFAFLGCAGLVFLALLGAAIAWDCARVVSSAYIEAKGAENEQRNQEDRVITALAAAGIGGEEVERAIAAYRAGTTSAEKDLLFQGVLAAAGRAPRPSSDVDDPLARRAADDLAGAQNRRAIALRNRQEMIAVYNETASGLRGSLGLRLTGLPARL